LPTFLKITFVSKMYIKYAFIEIFIK